MKNAKQNSNFHKENRNYTDSEYLTSEQRKMLTAFDRFNELEAQISYSMRLNYLNTLLQLGKNVNEPYERNDYTFPFFSHLTTFRDLCIRMKALTLGLALFLICIEVKDLKR